MNSRDHRVIIVTGASRGLGRSLALRFGSCGCRVAVNYREQTSAAESTAEEIQRQGGEAVACRADVRNSVEVETLMSAVLARWGAVDVLVNNAGITSDALAVKMDEAGWDQVMDTNLKGPFLCTRSASQAMAHQGAGHIINIASASGLQGREGQSNYAASKAGLIGLTKAAARELGRNNIRVNCVLPGYLPTDMGAAVSEAAVQRMLSESVLGRSSSADEVALFIYHLSLMQHVSGQVFNLDSRIL